MANVLNRSTKQFLRSVNTTEFDSADWIINPDLTAVDRYPSKYWLVFGDAVSLMNAAERDAVDAAEADLNKQNLRQSEETRSDEDILLMAIILVMRDGLNSLRSNAGLPLITKAQIKDAIKAEIANLVG